MFEDDDPLSTAATWSSGWAYRPSRRLMDPSIQIDRQRLQDAANRIARVPITNSTPLNLPPAGTPSQVTGVSATESPFKTSNNQMKSLVSVTFTINPSDTFFDRAHIWFTGYNGSSNPQLMVDARSSPASFICDTTNETVTVTVVAVGTTGLTPQFALAPSTTVVLDGVTSAPPAPSIAQTCLPIFGGVQFAFNVEGGLLADVVTNYKVYRNTQNNSSLASGAFVVATVPQNTASGSTTYVFQDSNVIANTNYWYWVSAVNQAGLESALTAAGTSVASFIMPSAFVNLLASPDLINPSGAFVAQNLDAVPVETWTLGVNSNGGVCTYRNGREIQIAATFAGGGSTILAQYKGIKRFENNQTVSFSGYFRRGGLVTNPTGTFKLHIDQLSHSLGAFGSSQSLGTPITSSAININTLSSSSYQLIRLVGTLTLIGGQEYWGFCIDNASIQDDLYISKPMLNVGLDSVPYSNTTFLTDIPPFTFDGNSFVLDDFLSTSKESNNISLTHHCPSTGGVAFTGTGMGWVEINESGTCAIVTNTPTVNTAQLTLATVNGALGSNFTTQGINDFSADTAAYYVQGDVNLGSGGTTTTKEDGVIGRWVDSNNFYLARLLNSSGTVSLDLYKRVAGTYTLLGTFAPGAISSGTIKLQITDAAKTVFLNGTQRITSADNVLTANGKVGVRLGIVASAAVTTTPWVDNFSAVYIQNVASPPAPPAAGNIPSSSPPPPSYDPGVERPPILNNPRQINQL